MVSYNNAMIMVVAINILHISCQLEYHSQMEEHMNEKSKAFGFANIPSSPHSLSSSSLSSSTLPSSSWLTPPTTDKYTRRPKTARPKTPFISMYTRNKNTSKISDTIKNNTSESNVTGKVETFFKDSKLTEKLVPTNAFLCLACVILNVLILYRYSKQLKKIVPILYFMNANVDIFIGVGVALQSVIFIPQIAADNEISGYLAAVSYMIVGVSIRVSTFVNLLLCIIRAINIISPFRYISRTSVVSATVCYTSLWVGLACWDEYWFHSGIGLTSGGLYVIKSLVLKPEVGFAAISTALGGSSSNLQNVLLLFVPAYLVPVVILVGSTSLQVYFHF